MKVQIDTTDKEVWQIGSGNDTRPYDDIFLKFGIAMVGPGESGDVRKPEAEEFFKKYGWPDWGSKLLQVKKGSIIVLRKGIKKILAVGKVLEEYDYSDLLADIHGWDLRHFVKVEWYTPVNPIIFTDTPLVQATLARVNNPIVINRIHKEEFIQVKAAKDLAELNLPKTVNIDEISQAFIHHGVRIQDADNVAKTIERIIKLAKWYDNKDPDALEHEIRTFLVIPLLISLGWSEQKMKIEYNHVDIAVFSKPYEKENELHPHMIVETKTFFNGLYYAADQIINYAKAFPECSLLVATNGYRYWIYEKVDGKFQASGYFNLFNMHEWYCLDEKIYGVVPSLLKLSNY